MQLSTIIASIAATIFMVVAAFIVGHKDGSPRALGLVAPIVAICTIPWFFASIALEWVVWIPVGVALLLFIVGLVMPDERDDIWHYSALAVGLLGNLIAWVVVMVGNTTVPVPLGIIVVVAVIALIVWSGIARSRRSQEPAPPRATN